MRPRKIRLSILFALLILNLMSCEQMFTTNIFSSIANPKPSASELSSMSASELEEFIASKTNLDYLTNSASLKAAALAALGYGEGQTPPSTATTADEQTAAVVAAEISLKTVSDAVDFSSSILAKLSTGTNISTTTTSSVVDFITSVLPDSLQSAAEAGDSMPSSFITLIDAYLDAAAAYEALGAGVSANGGSYASGLELSSSETADIAVNAVISGLVSAVVPASGGDTVAEALWSALTGTTTSFTIATGTIDDLTSGTGSIAALVEASKLGSLLGGED
jgi:hypothetical protein